MLETRHQTVLILLLLSLSHPSGGNNRSVRRLSQERTAVKTWLAGCLHATSKQVGYDKGSDHDPILPVGQALLMHIPFPRRTTEPDSSRFHSFSVCCDSSGRENANSQLAVYVLLNSQTPRFILGLAKLDGWPTPAGHDLALPKKDKNKSLAPPWASCKSGVLVLAQLPCLLSPTQRCSTHTVPEQAGQQPRSRPGSSEININN